MVEVPGEGPDKGMRERRVSKQQSPKDRKRTPEVTPAGLE
jgi:hypothetical protein